MKKQFSGVILIGIGLLVLFLFTFLSSVFSLRVYFAFFIGLFFLLALFGYFYLLWRKDRLRIDVLVMVTIPLMVALILLIVFGT
jgi:hypothetical protein